MLTSDHKAQQLQICKLLKNHYQEVRDEFLTQIVTYDETMKHGCTILILNQKGKVWNGYAPESPVRK